MNLHRMLAARAEDDRPVRVGLIGSGKFGTMYLAQARTTVGVHVVGIADLEPDRIRSSLKATGWDPARCCAQSVDHAITRGTTFVTDDADQLIDCPKLDVVIEATGVPRAGINHCRRAIAAGHHVVMVTVEADVVAGP